MQCTALSCKERYCTLHQCTALYRTIAARSCTEWVTRHATWYCTVLHCATMYCSEQQCTVLQLYVPHCTAPLPRGPAPSGSRGTRRGTCGTSGGRRHLVARRRDRRDRRDKCDGWDRWDAGGNKWGGGEAGKVSSGIRVCVCVRVGRGGEGAGLCVSVC